MGMVWAQIMAPKPLVTRLALEPLSHLMKASLGYLCTSRNNSRSLTSSLLKTWALDLFNLALAARNVSIVTSDVKTLLASR